jgi:aspartate/methionine/tyrosine aminotransferase
MAATIKQRLQEFQDSPLVLQAEFNLSASACEPMTYDELLALEEGVQENLFQQSLAYPARHGSEALRHAISNRYQGVTGEDVLVGSGVDDSLYMLFSALIEPGDRVVVLTPAYPPQLALPRRMGAEIIPWQARSENDWLPDLDELRKLIEPTTKMVVTTFPQNPTGFMPGSEFIRELVEIVAAKDIILVSDEIYSCLPHDNQNEPYRLVEHYEHALSIHGLSKTFGLPGLRVGWMTSRDIPLMDRIRDDARLFNCYVPTPVDYLARLALRHEKTLLARNARIVQHNLDLAKAFFARNSSLFQWKPPMAGVLSFPRWLGAGGTRAMSQQLLERASVALIPSFCLEAGDDHFRLSVSARNFDKGLARLEEYLQTNMASN